MKQELSIRLRLTERAVQENRVTGVTISRSTITVKLKPKVKKVYDRPDCQKPVTVERHDREELTIQGLGIPGKALRYQVKSIRLGYLNDAGQFTTFTLPVPGIRTDRLVTDAVVDKALYLNGDRTLSWPVAAEMLADLYQGQTRSSGLDRWQVGEAERLPSIGQLMQQLNEKKQ